MKYIVLTAKIGLLALVTSMLLPSGASWFIDLLNNNSQSMGLVVIFLGGFVNIAAYAAIAYGAYQSLTKG